MSHPSIFELRHFAVNGELEETYVSHISSCGECSSRLQRLARTELQTRGIRFEAATVTRPNVAAAMPAFLAVAATMLVLAVMRPAISLTFPTDTSAVEPEGVHGIPSVRIAERAPAWVDGGSAPGSE